VPEPQSKSNIDFEGTSALVDHGVSDSQITAMEQSFYTFAPTARTITVSTASIQVPVHQIDDDTFHILFTAKIDNIDYSAEIQYSGIDTLRLILTNSQGKQVYDSGDVDGSTL
jgi:hypothetical protein